MNTETGKLSRFEDEATMRAFRDAIPLQKFQAFPAFKDAVDGTPIEPPKDAANFVELAGEPKPDCRKCYGRGHIGRDTKTNLYVPCSCCT